jgi:SAM-dependent methyltransferase
MARTPEGVAMPAATERLASEQLFHDRQARGRAADFRAGRADLRFADADYLDHAPWVRPAFARLGPLAGRDALDFGCGHGMAAVVLARAGARATAFDLSGGYVREARERARANGVTVDVLQADGEQLPFPAGSFDAVWGSAILHHLDGDRAAAELHRVLRPGGVAVFCEPWAGNPALQAARRWLPYPGKHRTPDEQPLRRRDLRPLRRWFGSVGVQGFQLLGMVRRAWPSAPLGPWLDRCDGRLLRRWPALGNLCRYVVVTLRR